MDTFLDYTCTISLVAISLSGGEQLKSTSSIYSSIPCLGYATGSALARNTNLAQETDTDTTKIIIGPTYTSVREGYSLALYDPDLLLVGNYIIGEVRVYRDWNNNNDHIELQCDRI